MSTNTRHVVAALFSTRIRRARSLHKPSRRGILTPWTDCRSVALPYRAGRRQLIRFTYLARVSPSCQSTPYLVKTRCPHHYTQISLRFHLHPRLH